MEQVAEFDVGYGSEQLRRSAHPLRRLAKHFYLENVRRQARGPSIDFGCGAAQLLRRLPQGSIGFEVNPYLLQIHRAAGLDVRPYNPEDGFAFSMLEPKRYGTFIASHVVEHFDDAAVPLRTILGSCRRLEIERVIIIVPGARGYASDPTHKTFVNVPYLRANDLLACEGYKAAASYFPGNWEGVGRHFIFHELMLVYDRMH